MARAGARVKAPLLSPSSGERSEDRALVIPEAPRALSGMVAGTGEDKVGQGAGLRSRFASAIIGAAQEAMKLGSGKMIQPSASPTAEYMFAATPRAVRAQTSAARSSWLVTLAQVCRAVRPGSRECSRRSSPPNEARCMKYASERAGGRTLTDSGVSTIRPRKLVGNASTMDSSCIASGCVARPITAQPSNDRAQALAAPFSRMPFPEFDCPGFPMSFGMPFAVRIASARR